MPTRRPTKALASDAELEFEYFLAETLKRTVEQLRIEMSNEEFVTWSVYFGRKAQRQELATARAGARPKGR